MKPRKRPYIIQHPFAVSMQGARLLSYREETHGKRLDVVIEYQAIEQISSKLEMRDGKIFEILNAKTFPVRLHFFSVSELENGNYFSEVSASDNDDPRRTIMDLLSYIALDKNKNFYLLILRAIGTKDLAFLSSRVTCEKLPGDPAETVIERDWCMCPPWPQGIVPMPKAIHSRFGGDPVRVQIDSSPRRWKLFISGIQHQPESRPQGVDIVLNIGEDPSKWVRDGQVPPPDRWDVKGEGSKGMSVDELRAEAEWVANHLRAGKRVLVHCSAGVNRSATVCCAALIVLEGLSAEAALARVREKHPEAKPDGFHWLKLRWLAEHG